MSDLIQDCPSPELLEKLRRGELDGSSRQQLIRHLATCSRCSRAFASAPDCGRPVQDHKNSRRPTAALLIAVVFTSAPSLLLLHEHQASTAGRLPTLAAALEKLSERPSDGRLSGNLRYKPAGKESRGSSGSEDSQRLFSVAVGEIEFAGTHEQGVAYLVAHDFQKAVPILEQAARERPGDPFVLSDLSAAYEARGKIYGRANDYVAALDAAENAWRLRQAPETAWNRAIALSALNLTNAAERAWNIFLASDGDPDWQGEAVRRRTKLRQPTILDEWQRVEPLLQRWNGSNDRAVIDAATRFPGYALAAFETAILPRWAKARLAGDGAAASREYHLARTIAAGLAAGGEQLPGDAIDAIDRACTDPQQCAALASAHVLYGEAQTAIDNQDFTRATKEATQAQETFGLSGSPFALASRFQLASCMMHQNRFADARSAAAAMRQELDGKRYDALAALTFLLEGLAFLHDAKPEESIQRYEAAKQRFQQKGDLKNLAAVELRLADAYEYAGDPDHAMVYRAASFDDMHASGDTSELYLELFEAGTSLSQRGWPSAADVFLDESVRVAAAGGRPAVAALACMWRSTLSARRGDLSSAANYARTAAVYSAKTLDPSQQALLSASATQLGARAMDARETTDLVTDTIRFFLAAGNRAWLPQLLRQRALIHRGNGDLASAEADYRQAITITEEVLDDVAPAVMREGFTADRRADFEDLIGLLLDRDNSREALSYAERARLIGRRHPGDGDPLAPVARLGPTTTVALFEMQADSLTVWLVTHDSTTVFRSGSSHGIGQKVEAAARALPKDEALSTLYDLLVSDWIRHVTPESRLIIVPSPGLGGIPFPALLDRHRQRALVDDYVVSIASSLKDAAAPSSTVSRNDALLVVGNPAYEHLPRLPKSRNESLIVAGKYAHPRLLMEEQATARRFLSEIQSASVFHFAGHALVNDLVPEASSLMFAGENGEDGRVYVHELTSQHLHLKLVILSACSTAMSRTGAARGTQNLARAFIDAGAGAVVGTLWPVSDDAAAEFSVELHEALLRGQTAEQAVRSAQLTLKARAQGDRTWAAYCLIQGNASLQRR
jgi:tetratricopeptide (TPR) repeat protein